MDYKDGIGMKIVADYQAGGHDSEYKTGEEEPSIFLCNVDDIQKQERG